MKKKIFNILIISTSILFIYSSQTAIDFTQSGTGYTVSGNIVTISTDGTYELTGSQTDKKIIISSTATLNLNSLSLINNAALTPIVISSNKAVNLVLSDTTTLQDSSINENYGVIYLENGASLTISGKGTLNLNPKNYFAVYGVYGTSLTVNDGAKISITSTATRVGGIYLQNIITFNNAIINYSCPNSSGKAIDTNGDINIVKGEYNIVSGRGKGILTEKKLVLGELNQQNSNLILNIETYDEAIDAMILEINSGTFNIIGREGGINIDADNDICEQNYRCSGNCVCYFKFNGGNLTLTSNEEGIDANGDIFISGGNITVFAGSKSDDIPINQDGVFSITGGNVIIGGFSSTRRVSPTTTQYSSIYSGTVNSGTKLVVIKNQTNEELASLTCPKTANYMYFNFPSQFNVKLNDVQIQTSNSSSTSGSGTSRPKRGDDDDWDDDDDDDDWDDDDDDDWDDDFREARGAHNYIKLSKIISIIMLGLQLFL